MEMEFPRWFAGPGRQSISAVLSSISWVEHQKLGARYSVYKFEAKTYPDHLRMSAMLEGGFEPLSHADYIALKQEFEQLAEL